MHQSIFILALSITLGFFIYTSVKILQNFRITKSAYPIKNIPKRLRLLLMNGILQERIFRNHLVGAMHALVFWGFCVILFGSIEMVLDGVIGSHRILASLGWFYDIIIASGDIFAYVILIFISIFIIRRCCLNIKRLHGKELKKSNHNDAYMALTFILVLMLSLAGMNVFYILSSPEHYQGIYPISSLIAQFIQNTVQKFIYVMHDINWWTHILLIFLFANILPYSKHFHIFMSLPNVFLSRITPLGQMANMDHVTKEVKIMLGYSMESQSENQNTERFGILDIEDITWKNYIDSLSCTQCGRCSAVCPANFTGKALSPRKIIMDIRRRMNEKGKCLRRNNNMSDGKSLISDYIQEEEIWACTTCNACARECPLNIDQPTFILDLRRYLVMEKGSAPHQLNAIFANIENNGAPWQYSNQDRLKWAE